MTSTKPGTTPSFNREIPSWAIKFYNPLTRIKMEKGLSTINDT